jgi:mono/diheme cytochrome c family protein
VCHTLKDAGAAGTIGPDLDELKADAPRIKKVLQEGMGVMPSFADSLDEASMDAIVAYVVHATGGGK